MWLFYATGFLVLMGFDTLAQISFKFTALHALPLQANYSWLLRILREPWLYGAIAGYIGSFFTWVTLLRKAPIGPAFAASYLEVISILICSVLIFHEHLDLRQLIGAGSSIIGIICLAYAESRLQAEAYPEKPD